MSESIDEATLYVFDQDLGFRPLSEAELPLSYADLTLAFTEAVEGGPDLWWELPSWITLPYNRQPFAEIARTGKDPLHVVCRYTPAGTFVKYVEW